MDQLECQNLFDERLAAISLLETRLATDARPVPSRPKSFQENDLVAATGEAEKHIKLLRDELDGPRRAPSPPPPKIEAKVVFPKDPYGPDMLAAKRADAEHRISVCEKFIREHGGDVPPRPSLAACQDAAVECMTLLAHGSTLERFCREHGAKLDDLITQYQNPKPGPTGERKNMTATEKILAAKAAAQSGEKTTATVEPPKATGATAKLLKLHGVASLKELKDKLLAERGV